MNCGGTGHGGPEAIEGDPLPPGQVWAASMGTPESGPGLYRIEVTSGPGGGVKILNQPPPQAFRESVKVAEQNLYQRAKELVGDREPREHEFSIQMRAMDADKTGAGLGLRCWWLYAARFLARIHAAGRSSPAA